MCKRLLLSTLAANSVARMAHPSISKTFLTGLRGETWGTRFLRCDGCGEGGEREYGDVVFLTERLGSMGDLLRSLR